MAAASTDTVIRTGRVTRVFLYLVLLLFALFYLLPLFVMPLLYCVILKQPMVFPSCKASRSPVRRYH